MTVIERPDWECACQGDHRMTIQRAWCGDCSEWCYPAEGMLCIRGEYPKLQDENKQLRESLVMLRDGLRDLVERMSR